MLEWPFIPCFLLQKGAFSFFDIFFYRNYKVCHTVDIDKSHASFQILSEFTSAAAGYKFENLKDQIKPEN